MRPAAFFTTAVTYCSHGERFGGAHWPVRIRYVRPRGCPSRRPAERVENLRIPAQVRDIGIQRAEVVLSCRGIRLSPIQSWPGVPCPGCAEGQLRLYFLIVEDSEAKKSRGSSLAREGDWTCRRRRAASSRCNQRSSCAQVRAGRSICDLDAPCQCDQRDGSAQHAECS